MNIDSNWTQAISSIVAIIISTVTLLYTAKIQRDAVKPYIVAYIQQVPSGPTLITYLIIKNFGKTAAWITDVSANPQIKSGKMPFENNPFNEFSNQLIAPSQTYVAAISVKNSEAQLETEKFTLMIKFRYRRNKEDKVTYPLDLSTLTNLQRFVATPTTQNEVAKAIYATSREESITRL